MLQSAVIVLDFETTGHSPAFGDRPIEVGAVRLENGTMVDRFQALMNPGFTISWFIESLTGISNELVREAPDCEEVMTRFADWIGDTPLAAHNAGFDGKFLDAELARIGRERTNPMACTVLASRRLFPEAPNHKLATLVRHLDIFTTGTFHRALADAEMTGRLWLAMTDLLRDRYQLEEVPFALMQALTRIARTKVDRFIRTYIEGQGMVPFPPAKA
ncbi:MAG: 3'-5' exonuclease [Desulfobulbus sp.]|jgi:DNA polymerase-3 subunit epsilon|uniref:3'-5' exonuclease n=1 Tax=Desulfobulbus sp. TaxID=895 RepID=UPI00283C7FCD|nr:3'-5' exonuclease [Desulfobulbus sp.]MDR2549203.1 3'-5' exonuclease [Desulfobulbus sp.]